MSEAIPVMLRVRVGIRIVNVRLVKNNEKTVWVELPDGNIIKRHKVKHVVVDSPVSETVEAECK